MYLSQDFSPGICDMTLDDFLCETIYEAMPLSHGSSGRCRLLLIHPISDNGNTLAMAFPWISASGNGP